MLWPFSLPAWLYNEDGISEATSLWENAPSWELGTGRTGGKSPVQHTDGRANAEQLTHSWPEKISFPQVLARWEQVDLRLTGHLSHWNSLQRIGLKNKITGKRVGRSLVPGIPAVSEKVQRKEIQKFFALVHSIEAKGIKKWKGNNPFWLCPSDVTEVKTESQLRAWDLILMLAPVKFLWLKLEVQSKNLLLKT